jgi:iron complex transport system ATP-binding protein
MSPIKLRNVSLSRGNTIVLQNIDLTIPRGEWTSIIGPNGAGKSTLVQALAGLLPYEGSIQIGGAELRSIAIKARAQQIAWLEQATSIPDSLDFALRVYEVAMLGRLPHQNWLCIPSEEDCGIVERAMQQTDVWGLRERFFNQLSGGERQRVLLARLFAVQAGIIKGQSVSVVADIKVAGKPLTSASKRCRSGVAGTVPDKNAILDAWGCSRWCEGFIAYA